MTALLVAFRQKEMQAMALVRRTLNQIRRVKPRVDRAKIDATTEADIRRHMIEDGQDPAMALAGFAPVIPPRALRKRGRPKAAYAPLRGGITPCSPHHRSATCDL